VVVAAAVPLSMIPNPVAHDIAVMTASAAVTTQAKMLVVANKGVPAIVTAVEQETQAGVAAALTQNPLRQFPLTNGPATPAVETAHPPAFDPHAIHPAILETVTAAF